MSASADAIGVVGAGRLGSALALSAAAAGYRVVAVASATRAHAEELCTRLQVGPPATVRQVCERATLVLLTVPDAAIAPVCASLSVERGQSVVHCSGALGLEVLSSVRAQGALAGCLHPLQTFPERMSRARFTGIHCGIEADAGLDAILAELCMKLGAKSFALAGIDRARYHAAAVFASNYLVALHAASARLFASMGLSEELARSALSPLTLATAHSVSVLPLAEALTGPIARGDTETVQKHLAALAGEPGLHALYRQLGRRLLDLELGLEAERRAALLALLND